MNDEQLDDLKQFLATTVSQSSTLLRDELVGRLDQVDGRLEKLETQVGSLETQVGDLDQKIDAVMGAIGEHNQASADQLRDHEARLTQLESRPA